MKLQRGFAFPANFANQIWIALTTPRSSQERLDRKEETMQPNNIVSREQWLEARKALMAQEKEFTRTRDRLSEQRRALPWVRVEKTYVFDSPAGQKTLADLFDGRSQLVVQHFMFAPDWEAGCKSCSFWADQFDRIIPHLKARDTTLVAVSRAPLPKLEDFKRRMGWSFDWYSSANTDFNQDFAVSFTPQELNSGEKIYNFKTSGFAAEEAPGISVFYRDESGGIFHTYSCFARGLDMMNAAYQYLDLTPLGRHEEGAHPMAWVRLRDQY
jgi:predicted dithiol-disulfide oxidoreductase (DUF899 family)